MSATHEARREVNGGEIRVRDVPGRGCVFTAVHLGFVANDARLAT